MRYRPELDGLRSIAVYLVVVYHAGVGALGGGFVGVDLFFVLSGFLVTGVILREVDQRGTFSLGGFYARRVRRLLPAALLVVVATAAVQVLVSSIATRVDLIGDARASLLYVANWHFIAESGDYFAQDDAPSPFLHFWSLAIEEQFYVVFPLLVLLVLRFARRPVRALVVAVGAVAVASLGLQLWRASSDAGYAYYATETRVYQLAAGVGLTLVLRRWQGRPREPRAGRIDRVGTPVAVVGLVGLLLVATARVDVSASVRGLLATAAAVLLIAGLSFAPRGPIARGLALPLPRYLGQVSYATYLWHWPVILVLIRVMDADPWVVAVLGATLATSLAALSGQVLETPVRRSALLDRRRWSVAAAGVALSAVVALVVVAPVLELDRRPVIAAAGATPGATGIAGLDQPVPDVDLVAARADTGQVTRDACTVDALDACTRVEGGEPHVLLVGDSQAEGLTDTFASLAREQGFTLSTNVKGGCPWQADQVNTREGTDAEGQARCTEVRDDFYADVLPLMDVDVVVVVGLSRSDEYWETRLTSPGGPPGESLDELQLRTTRATAAMILDAAPRLVIVDSIFGTDGYGLEGFDPIECLAAAQTLGECAVEPPRERPAVDDVYGVLDTEQPDIATVDLTDVVCPDRPLCRPVEDGIVVWADRDHVTSSWYLARRADIWSRLQATGFLGVAGDTG